MVGVNISGADMGEVINNGQVVSSHFTNYIHPPLGTIAAFAAAGAKSIRYPFKWERVQRYLNGALSSMEMSLINERVAAITNAGMVCVLDMHNYMRRALDAIEAKKHVMGQPLISKEHFADVWGKIADIHKNNPLVWFNLMNEPHDISNEIIYDFQQAAINAIRATGATNKILVSIDTWSSVRVVNSPANMATLQQYVDPANNWAVDVHQYVNPGLAGNTGEVVDPQWYEPFFINATNAARSIGVQLYLGEFNAGYANNMTQKAWDAHTFVINIIKDNPDVWIDMALWANSPWWQPSYHFPVNPDSETFIRARDAFNLNPTYHFKADEGVTIVDGKVSQWQDVKTGFTVAQANVDNRPVFSSVEINGKPAIRFEGWHWLQGLITAEMATLADGDNSIVILVKELTAKTSQSIVGGLDTSGANRWGHRVISGTKRGINNIQLVSADSGVQVTGNRTDSMIMERTGNDVSIDINGAVTTLVGGAVSPAFTSSNIFSIGRQNAVNAGHIAETAVSEILIFDHALTPYEKSLWRESASTEYGVVFV